MDAINGTVAWPQCPISPRNLPEVARSLIQEEVP
jgi:hypothetical protein